MNLPKVGTYQPEFHGPEKIWQECTGNERALEPESTYQISRPGKIIRTRYTCRTCWETFYDPPFRGSLGVVKDGDEVRPVPHLRLMSMREQADERLIAIGESLGFKRWDDAILDALDAANRRTRVEHVDARVARGMSILTEALTRRAATPQLATALGNLMSFTRDTDDVEFFTEATLYELIGKDDARTLLALIRAVDEASGHVTR